MTEFLPEYSLFLAKFLSVAVVIVIMAVIIVFLVSHSRTARDDHIEIHDLNHKYDQLGIILKSAILPKKQFKQDLKDLKKAHKSRQKAPEKQRKRVFVLRFHGDIRASNARSLAEEITALLMIAGTDDRALLVLESAGGTVHGYGYAASQLSRIRDKGLHLTVAVDKVAASGGYMMACVADRIIAAPFAIIGSIGVLGQVPNFNRLLKKHNIDFEQISAGEYKRTLSVFGENTEAGREKFRQELEETHDLFKRFVKDNREQVNIDAIATGEHWYGSRALELRLVDELKTSESYITEAATESDVFEITHRHKKSIPEKLMAAFARINDMMHGHG